ncbi:hypothetical protein AB0K60_22135 [Thermopolyspora sp. NPDC052614]|uniref:hypothetical protein n=1 Tax=Thermopolyspora sp. NPDC052614 TaxID=3155682 RepID=UPI00342D2F28
MNIAEQRRGRGARLAKLEHRYRRLLFAYPPGYRAGHGDELIGTILDGTEPGRSLPSPRESAALIAGGLRTRAVQAAAGPAWADGLHLGATVLAVLNLATLVRYAGSVPLWTTLSALTLLAVLRGWARSAIPLVAITGVKTAGLAMGVPLLGVTLLPVDPDTLLPGITVWQVSALHAVGGPIAPVTGYALLLAALLTLALRGGPARTRSPWWWLAVPAIAVTEPAWLQLTAASPRAVARVGLEIALFGLAIWAGHVARDPRWAIAGGTYLLVTLVLLVENGPQLQRDDLSHWGLLAFLALTAAAIPLRARRRVLL